MVLCCRTKLRFLKIRLSLSVKPKKAFVSWLKILCGMKSPIILDQTNTVFVVPKINVKKMWSTDLQAIIQAIGHIGIFAIVFAESGLFFGFFFPGDSLLFTAGLLASK